MRNRSLRWLILAACLWVACTDQVELPQAFPTLSHAPTLPSPATLIPSNIGETSTIPATPGVTLTFVLPTLTAYPDDQHFSLGDSVEGRAIWAWQFGDGPRTIVLVGGMHGGFEGNTVVLSELLVDYFRRNSDDVLPGIRLVIIPAANPDGLPRGSEIEGRFNARGIDLNRNWGCEWEDTAFLRDLSVDPGPRPFSEPESLALRSYFVAQPPDVVIFYHSAAGGVFLGACGDAPPAAWLGELLEDATGYPHLTFDFYEVSGDASNWLAERGIPAAVIELFSKEDAEFEPNLAGVIALQCYFALRDAVEPLAPAIVRLCDE